MNLPFTVTDASGFRLSNCVHCDAIIMIDSDLPDWLHVRDHHRRCHFNYSPASTFAAPKEYVIHELGYP